jgi:hypothetical protein
MKSTTKPLKTSVPAPPLTDSPDSAIELIPTRALTAVGLVFAAGCRKYEEHNWRKAIVITKPEADHYLRLRFRNAAVHLFKWAAEHIGVATPTGEDHLAKVMWFCAIAIEICHARSAMECNEAQLLQPLIEDDGNPW